MQTAVEWLIEQIKNDQNQKALSAKEWLEVLHQAKEMEKQQIERAWDEKCIEGSISFEIDNRTSEEYYNDTYGSKRSDDQVPDVRKMVEISDEEIRKYLVKLEISLTKCQYFEMGAKWYREQLKKKQ